HGVPGDPEAGHQDGQTGHVESGPRPLFHGSHRVTGAGGRAQLAHEVSLGRGSTQQLPSPTPPRMPATIQKRTTMVTSFQPLSSKWCCRGAIRNTRLPVSLKLVTWMITDREMITNRPPMMAPSTSVRETMVKPAIAPPRASDPVSPMKIFAGEVF